MAEYSIKELELLVQKIKSATGLTQEDIDERAGYRRGYISQIKTRGHVPEKLIRKLNLTFQKDLDKIAFDLDAASVGLEQLLNVRAKMDVYGGLIIEILAILRKTPATALAEEVNSLLDRRLQKLRHELES